MVGKGDRDDSLSRCATAAGLSGATDLAKSTKASQTLSAPGHRILIPPGSGGDS